MYVCTHCYIVCTLGQYTVYVHVVGTYACTHNCNVRTYSRVVRIYVHACAESRPSRVR